MKVLFLGDVVGKPGVLAVRTLVPKLIASRWLNETQPGWVALPTRTHRDTIAELLDEEPRRALHCCTYQAISPRQLVCGSSPQRSCSSIAS